MFRKYTILIFFLGIFKIRKIRDSSFVAILILRLYKTIHRFLDRFFYKTIDRSLKIKPLVVFPVNP